MAFFNPREGAVGAMGTDGFEDIGHAEDSGLQHNCPPGQAFGITGTVQPLMVLEDNLGQGPGEIDLFQNVIAGLHVASGSLRIREHSAARACRGFHRGW